MNIGHGRKAALRRRLGGQPILAYASVLLLCVAGIAGCSSSGSDNNPPNGSDNNSGSAAVGAQPSGCFTSSFVRPSQKLPTARESALASARLTSYEAPLPIIPRPDYNFDEVRPAEEGEQQQADWANQGLDYAQAHPQERPGTFQAPTQGNLLTVANAVKSTEETELLRADLSSGDMAGYGDEMCRAIAAVDSAISNLNDVSQVVSYLQQVVAPQDNTQAPNDLASVVQDAYNQFANAFESCVDLISSGQWILQEIQNLFCGG
jgi:hypothetical protein